MKTLVVHCHPDPNSFNRALYDTSCAALRQAGNELRTIDLYAEGFDPVMKRDERECYNLDPALIEVRVQAHVDALRWASWQYSVRTPSLELRSLASAEHSVLIHP